MKKLFLLIYLALQGFSATATHIAGGEMNYRNLGNNNYEIRLTVYRDCFSGLPPFDDPAAVGIFDINNNLIGTLLMDFTSSDILMPTGLSPCLIPPSDICYEKTTYIENINLPPIPGGYRLVYQRCCRNSSIINIINPFNVGGTYIAIIPGPSLAAINSNPVFNNWPPAFICLNESFSFDHSATDLDGDSLVYLLCDPLDGPNNPCWYDDLCCQTSPQPCGPMPQPPYDPPYINVVWQPPYGLSNLFGGTPLTIDPQTGWLTAIPNVVGQFVYGVCVQEYRNGNFLGETRRDYQMNVVNCPQIVGASILSPTFVCGTLTASFVNNSYGASSYFWDFGVPSMTNDTSHLTNPSFTYPDTGTYTVMLIAHSSLNSACIDTNWGTVTVYPALNSSFTYQGMPCSNTVTFTDASPSTSGIPVSWQWNFGDNNTSSVQNPTHTYSTAGNYVVTLIVTTNVMCTGTVSMTVPATGTIPAASFTAGVLPCYLTGTFTNTSSNAVTWWWDFGDGDSSSIQNPQHTFPQSGTYNVTLTVTDSNGCTGTVTKSISPFTFSIAGFSFRIDTCAMQVLFTDHSVNGVSMLWDFGDGNTGYDFSPFHVYSHSGIYHVVLTTNPGTICADTLETDVNYELSGIGNIWIPNAFTPNSDGKNDVFEVYTYYPCDEFTFTIFNHWGQKIYETSDSHITWNGMFDGKLVEGGIYVYLLKGTYTERIGSIAVIR